MSVKTLEDLDAALAKFNTDYAQAMNLLNNSNEFPAVAKLMDQLKTQVESLKDQVTTLKGLCEQKFQHQDIIDWDQKQIDYLNGQINTWKDTYNKADQDYAAQQKIEDAGNADMSKESDLAKQIMNDDTQKGIDYTKDPAYIAAMAQIKKDQQIVQGAYNQQLQDTQTKAKASYYIDSDTKMVVAYQLEISDFQTKVADDDSHISALTGSMFETVNGLEDIINQIHKIIP